MEQEKSIQQKFMMFFGELMLRYPNSTITIANGAAYWNVLRTFSLASIIGAFERAVNESPVFFPTCEAVRQHAKVLDKQLKNQIPQERKLLAPGPTIRLSKDNEFEKLAQRWEEESRQAPWFGDCPKAVGLRRMNELLALMDGHPIFDGVIPNKPKEHMEIFYA